MPDFLGIIRPSAWKPGYQLGRKIAVDLFFVGGTDKVGAAALIMILFIFPEYRKIEIKIDIAEQ